MSWALFAILTVFVVLLAVEAVRDVADPATTGVLGKAVATECGHQHGGLHCYGDFTADDGSIHLHDVQIWNEDFGHVGQTYTARGNSGTGMVTVDSAQGWWSDVVGMLVFLIAWAAVFVFLIYLPIRRRRRLRAAPSP